MPAVILCPVSYFTGWHEPLHGLRLRGNRTFWKQQKKRATKNPTARKQLAISIKHTLKIGDRLCRLCAVHQRKKAAAISLPQLFGGSWWIRTTEALSSRFTVCPHWPLGKAPIFCFASAVSPGDVCYYSKGVSKLQAFFWIFLRFFQKSLFCSQHRTKTILDILLRLAYIYI